MKDSVKRIRSSEKSSILFDIAKSIVPKPLSAAPNAIPLSLCPKEVTVRSKSDWDGMIASQVEVIVVEDGCCNESEFETLDLSGFERLKKLTVGDFCFQRVCEVKMIGMKCLESVVIGSDSFVKYQYKASDGRDDRRHFYLRNCPKLKALKMGRYSFMDYTICSIENVSSLETIEMGELYEESCNFDYASSFQLKSTSFLKS